MKKIFFILLGMAATGFYAQAQQKKSGAIQFENTFDPAASMAANGVKLTDEMLARIPKSSKSNFELLFNTSHASYMRADEVEDSNGAGAAPAGGGMRFAFGGGGGSNREYFYSFADNKLTEVFEMNDTTYFLQSKLSLSTQQPMRMGNNQGQATQQVPEVIKSDETKKIIGLNCHKVIVKSTRKFKIGNEEKEVTDQTTIWYTQDLGFNFSPNPNLWTEGAVLAIEGRGVNIQAKSIEYRNVSARDVNLPKKGTPITQEEYRAKIEQMMKQFRGNGNRAGGSIRTMQVN